MENKLINIIYDILKDKNLYNYDNDEELKDVEIEIYYNLLQEKCIRVRTSKEEYVITCNMVYKGVE